MEKKQTNWVVTFLMAIGVIFVLIAGGIFVKQTWQYLPEAVKHLCLLAVSIGSMVGSVVVSNNDVLKKTQRALFYIGDSFLGFFVVSVLGGSTMKEMIPMNVATILFAACMAMIIPLGVRMYFKPSSVDFVLTVLMTDAAVMFGLIANASGFGAYTLALAITTFILYVLSKVLDGYGSKAMDIWAKVCYLVHEMYTLLWITVMCLALGVDGESLYVSGSVQVMTAAFIIAICIVLSGLIWYDNDDLDVIQSIATCGLLGVLLVYSLAAGGLAEALIVGVISLMIAIVAGVKENKVYLVISSLALLSVVFYITKDFWLSIAWWVYMFVAGVIMILIAVKKEREGR